MMKELRLVEERIIDMEDAFERALTEMRSVVHFKLRELWGAAGDMRDFIIAQEVEEARRKGKEAGNAGEAGGA